MKSRACPSSIFSAVWYGWRNSYVKVSTKCTRSRARTTGAPFSRDTATSAVHPECTRKPSAACFESATSRNLLRRRAFDNLPDDFARAAFILGWSVYSRVLTMPLHANRDSVFFQRCSQKPCEIFIVSGPHFARGLANCRRFRFRRCLRRLFIRRQRHVHRPFVQKLFENYLCFGKI